MHDGRHEHTATLEQPLDAGPRGGPGETDPLGQRLVRQTAVRLQLADDGEVDVVQVHRGFPSARLPGYGRTRGRRPLSATATRAPDTRDIRHGRPSHADWTIMEDET